MPGCCGCWGLIAAWQDRNRRAIEREALLPRVEVENLDGALPAGRNPSDVAALVMATLRGLYMLPPESRNPKRGEQALRELERSLGI